jgi:membrane protease YdiL (CAAX protease family)
MQLVALAILLVALAAIGWDAWRSKAEYAAFKALTDTSARQRCYRRWLATAFAIFTAGSLVALALLRRLDAVMLTPGEFASLARAARGLLPLDQEGPMVLGAAAGGFTGGVAILVAVSALRRRRRSGPAGPFLVGDIAALLPRNGQETVWTGLLALNAGVGEELFFRLMLPLLLCILFGQALAAFAIAAAIFGLAHVYQGWVGVLATTVVGVVLTGVYLAAGTLLAPIVIHATIDLVGLVVRPSLARFISSRAEPAT